MTSQPTLLQRLTNGSAAWLAGLAMAVILPLFAAAQPQTPDEGSAGVAYETEIKGDLSTRVRDLIEESSALLTEKDRLPGSEAALRRRLRDDLDRIGRILRSEGYYAHEIEQEVDDSRRPVRIEIDIRPGAAFRLRDYSISYRGEVSDDAPRNAEDVGLQLDQRARAAALQGAETRISQWLKRNGYPFGRVANTRYLALMEEAGIRAEITVEPGQRALFGPLVLEGVETVEEDYLEEIVDWKQGSLYDERETERVRRKLADTGLFNSVVARTPDSPGDGEIPVTLEVTERPPRTIGAGLSYSTDEDGPGAEVFWEHRNLLGEGETLELEAGGTQLRQQLTANFRKPNFRRLDQTLVIENELRREDSDAFKELTSEHFLGLQRPLANNWTARAGPTLMITRVEEDDDISNFGLLGFTGGVRYDGSNDALNPTRGARFAATVTPYVSVAGEKAQFLSTETDGSVYYAPFESDRLVLAARGRFGSLNGSSRGDIPANLRFYAGGGGSIRGYEFRSVGPLDDDNDPTGGRSVIELGLEARLRVTESIGLVPFLDAGQVYDTPWPTGGELQYAAGLGLRYFTSFGPLRLDVATPLNPRDGVDRDYQFYISIGQSF